MAYPPHLRLQFGGTYYGTEQWTCGLHMTSSAPFANLKTIARENLTRVRDKVTAQWTTGGLGFSPQAKLDFIKFNAINSEGLYDDDAQANSATVVGAPLNPGITGTVNSALAPQLSIVVSFGTAKRTGPAARGRIYVPAVGLTMASTNSPFIQTSAVQAIATRWAAFLGDVSDWPGFDVPTMPVFANVSNIDAASQEITTVRVGNVYDTQRRRRNAFREAYSSAAVA